MCFVFQPLNFHRIELFNSKVTFMLESSDHSMWSRASTRPPACLLPAPTTPKTKQYALSISPPIQNSTNNVPLPPPKKIAFLPFSKCGPILVELYDHNSIFGY